MEQPTRFVLIDHTSGGEGRLIDKSGLKVSSQLQDEGKTLKVFLDDPVKEYYLQDSRQVVGNCMLWWAKGKAGYVTSLDEAHVFTEEEKAATAVRDTDVWWSKDYIDLVAGRMVDCQRVRR